MKHAHATRPGLFPETPRECARARMKCRLPGVRRFAASLLCLFAASCVLFAVAACSPVDDAGTIPRSNVHAPRAPHRLTVHKAMLFEVGENPLEKKTVDIPVGEYIFEGEDDVFLYFRSPTEMEYRVYHKEGYAEGAFQLGGLALARKEQWDNVEYPACTYIDGEEPHQKRLTCPLESSYLMQKRGTDWESDFDKE